ncbi:PLP-dependent aminotransferase family protein [Brevibacillus laterosporus]|uniref:PLP-dependent aminotransferase family protein n=1 Tax=Brevibacillus laterosporus TaxID=1465 RepID=A0A518VDI1_BRELA|nr:PLP-dependent aminotransferase family protein [Brevibacillus laterosporus]
MFFSTTKMQQKKPMYQQLYEAIKTDIENNRLVPGSKLLSVRQMAQEWQVSRNTVEAAYHQLLDEGYVKSKEKSGYYVEDLLTDGWTRDLEAGSVEQTNGVVHSEEDSMPLPIRYDFVYGKVDGTAFPVKQWRACMQEAMQSELERTEAYGEYQGEYQLREALATYVYQARGIKCVADQIFIGSGTQQLASLLCQTVFRDKSVVAMENPGYDRVRHVFHQHEFSVQPIQLDEDGIRLDQLLTSKADIAYVTPSHQYPYGMVMSIVRRLQIIAWAKETGAYLIEDDYDGEFRYGTKPIPALKALDDNGRIIYFGTASKVLLPSLRISYMILPQTLVTQYKELWQKYLQTAPRVIQYALALFIQKGEWARHIRRMRNLYAKKHRLLLQSLEKTMGERIEIIGSEAGLHILLRIHTTYTENELITRASQRGCQVYSIDQYYQRKEGQQENLDKSEYPVLLLGFGAIPVEEITAGVEELHKAWWG